MAVDLLIAVADGALRRVIEVALRADGYVVRSAASDLDIVRALSDKQPDLLVLDGTMPLSANILAWVDRHAPHLPVILIRVVWEDRPPARRPHVFDLPMPFGRDDLRRAIATALSLP